MPQPMELPHLPSEQVTAQLEAQALLDNALSLYSSVIIKSSDPKLVATRCREYLELPQTSPILQNKPLRKAIYYLVFRQKTLQHSKIETYWDVVTHFGKDNHKACIDYLQSAPKSVPLKLGRLLLFKSEFGSNLSVPLFRIVVSIFFSIPSIVEAVVTPEWRRQLAQNKALNRPETPILIELADRFALDGPVHALAALFPQITPVEANAVLQKTSLSLEQVTQNILDDPDYVKNTLHPTASAFQQKTRKQRPAYVDLDSQERKAREERIRAQSRRNFVYEYTPLEEIDPEPEDDDAGLQSELSEADKKLAAQEQLLWAQWEQNRDVFSRESRKSPARNKLKSTLNWTDEQVEGWGKFTGSKGRSGEVNLTPRDAREVASYAPSVKTEEPGSKHNTKHTKPDAKPDAKQHSTKHSTKHSSKPDNAKHSTKQDNAKHNTKPDNAKPKQHNAKESAKESDTKRKDARPKSKPDRSKRNNDN